jgi:hypothetical protein
MRIGFLPITSAYFPKTTPPITLHTNPKLKSIETWKYDNENALIK